jgi:hypothetical protein
MPGLQTAKLVDVSENRILGEYDNGDHFGGEHRPMN